MNYSLCTLKTLLLIPFLASLALSSCSSNGSVELVPTVESQSVTLARKSVDDLNDHAFDQVSHRVLEHMRHDLENRAATGDPDLDFAIFMKKHHQGSTDLGTAEIHHGHHAEAKHLAQVATSRNKESMEHLKSFLNHHSINEKLDPAVYNQYKEDMKSVLKQLIEAYSYIPNTSDVDLDFVRRLIEHNKGAIGMATLQLKYGNDKATTEVANSLIIRQANEIKELAIFAAKHGTPNP